MDGEFTVEVSLRPGARLSSQPGPGHDVLSRSVVFHVGRHVDANQWQRISDEVEAHARFHGVLGGPST